MGKVILNLVLSVLEHLAHRVDQHISQKDEEQKYRKSLYQNIEQKLRIQTEDTARLL